MALRVLHILDHSVPVLDGYSHRSRSLISAQQKLGLQPSVLTGPLHNLDDPQPTEIDLDGVHYYRTPQDSSFYWQAVQRRRPILREWAVVRLLRKRILSILRTQSFDLLHAHSPALCGLAAAQAARASRLPFVYEIRSFWEDGVDQSTASPRYRLTRALETRVVRRADAVVGIAKLILSDIASRGIPESRLFRVPNGVDSCRFVPRARDLALAERLGVRGVPTLGFIGTFFPWEGVPWLVEAAATLRARGTQFKLLIVGDGVDANAMRAAIASRNAGEYVTYIGRVPHEEIERYYSVIDALVYPRRRLRITEKVTPLKPLEAMALGKAILGSNVGGIRELVDPGETGLLFEPENIPDFCEKAANLLNNAALREQLGRRAREKTSQERDWQTIAGLYGPAYSVAQKNAAQRY